jgi:hypothetical protein
MRVHIYPYIGKLELRDIRPSTVQGWLRGRQDACAPSYVRLLLAHVNSVLGAAVDDGLIAKNPCAARAVRAPAVAQKEGHPLVTGDRSGGHQRATPAVPGYQRSGFRRGTPPG